MREIGATPVIVILGANNPLGQSTALAFADKGTRVVVIDADADALAAICDQNPGWIEAIAIANIETDMRGLLKDSWNDAQIEMVVNLLPLAHPADISAQMRSLTTIVRTMLRGLVKGQGTLVNVAERAADPLAFVAHGMGAALTEASSALAAVVADKGVRVHCLTLPAGVTTQAVDTLRHLTSATGRTLRSTTLYLEVTPAE